MSKRIFTKRFSGEIQVSMIGYVEQNALETWLLQDDIEILGAEIVVAADKPSENDGFAIVSVELSQTGVALQDGAIILASASEGWNTAPPGISMTNGHAVVTFPQGTVIPVREEGHLYINARGRGKSAGVSTFGYGAVVYYTKGSSRKR